MSTFDGNISEIKNIAVDKFQEHNYSATAYFLSHIHTDHIHGIHDSQFYQHLKKHNYYIYTSELTRIMLIKKFPHLDPFLKCLEVRYPQLITLEDGNSLCVTALPAGHCPGSVMFLFETNDKRILYTGDIRLENNEIKKFKHLHSNLLDQPITIDCLYFDSTFFHPKYPWFPTRDESISKICEEIDTWLRKNDQNQIYIHLTAEFSIEYVFIRIYKDLKQQIYMNRETYENIYKYIPEMDNVITFNETMARIKAGRNYNFNSSNENLLKIRASALRWTKNVFNETSNEIIQKKFNTTFICYSSHCSYTELIDLIHYLKPKKIIPCVNPEKVQEQEELEKFVDKYNFYGIIDEPMEDISYIPQVEEPSNEISYFYDDSGLNEVLTFRQRSSSRDSVESFLVSGQET